MTFGKRRVSSGMACPDCGTELDVDWGRFYCEDCHEMKVPDAVE